MGAKETLHICMGSACHQTGVFNVLPVLQQLIAEHDLQDRLELKGAFCLGACSRAIVLKLGDVFITDVNSRNVRKKFLHEVLPLLEGVKQ
ncbi:MAG: (2Fe-2S) ferredoxin domain-containing protein [Chloroflexi bacterium]|nr:(2Fe-2S) ferredoxin domain-containing protein [Chloroflexota bacterium]